MKDERNMKFVKNIKDIGQSLIDNAETMVDYKYLKDIVITCYVFDNGESPYIEVNTDFYPENVIKRFENGTYEV